MTFTFNASLNTAISRVRQYVGDTTSERSLIADETITAYITRGFSELRTAAQLCRDIAAQFARIANLNVDHQSTESATLSAQFLKLAQQLDERAAAGELPPTNAAYNGVIVTDCNTSFPPADTSPPPNLNFAYASGFTANESLPGNSVAQRCTISGISGFTTEPPGADFTFRLFNRTTHIGNVTFPAGQADPVLVIFSGMTGLLEGDYVFPKVPASPPPEMTQCSWVLLCV